MEINRVVTVAAADDDDDVDEGKRGMVDDEEEDDVVVEYNEDTIFCCVSLCNDRNAASYRCSNVFKSSFLSAILFSLLLYTLSFCDDCK